MSEPGARQLMIDAAEKIVAEQGIAAMTFNGVQLAANQANKSAAKYHFGSREGLLEAVVEARMAAVNSRRQEMLNNFRVGGGSITLRDAVEALVRPFAAETLGRPGSRYARFVVQALTDPALGEIMPKHLMAESYRSTHRIMIELCPAADGTAQRRADNVVMLTMAALATHEGRTRTASDTDEIVADLVDSCVAILQAPFRNREEASRRATEGRVESLFDRQST
ncbi:TetR/AcrR family transcriptional regulator [Prescottella equi]|uniref:TetR/AcrR family transcriptional regulator n=1 Tax=Rhodococcus hoagii TaxID=43767 RepID=UPI003B7CA89A